MSLQAIAQKAEVLGECHESTGWFRRRIMRHFTTILRQRFEPLAPAGSVSATTASGIRPGGFDLFNHPCPTHHLAVYAYILELKPLHEGSIVRSA